MSRNTLITYYSEHHHNTEKIAGVMAKSLGARLMPISEVTPEIISESVLVGFGSGIYFDTFHQKMFEFLKGLPNQRGKKAFLFYTSGIRKLPIVNCADAQFRHLVEKKGFIIVGTFGCRGWDTYPRILRPFGGIHKHRPGTKDCQRAALFATCLSSVP